MWKLTDLNRLLASCHHYYIFCLLTDINYIHCREASVSEQSKGNWCASFEIIINIWPWPIYGSWSGGLLHIWDTLSPMCSHLQINPFVRRLQELLLPEHVCGEWPILEPLMVSGIRQGLQGGARYAKKTLQLIKHIAQHRCMRDMSYSLWIHLVIVQSGLRWRLKFGFLIHWNGIFEYSKKWTTFAIGY